MNSPVVSVVMLSYNHEAYIQKAIESVITQITRFKVELLIGEDFSTDGTREVVIDYQKNHPNKIKLIISEVNVGLIANERRVLKACKGKYITFCEGDDYWTDPYKLQKQVDFLESNPDYGLVHGDVNHLDQKSGKITKAYNNLNNIKIPNGHIFEYLMRPSHSIKTMTTCFRRDLFEKHYLSNIEIMKSDWALIDISIWLMLSLHCKIHYFDEVFATYRLLPESMSRTKNPEKLYYFHQKIHAIRDYYKNKYKCSKETTLIIETNKYKLLLADSYNLMQPELSKEAYSFFKKHNVSISFKEKLLFYLNYYWLMRKLRSVIK